MRLRGLAITLACLLSAFWAVPALAATNAVDPTGDNCKVGTEPGCGPDLTGAADSIDTDGTVSLSITRVGSVCANFSYPAIEVQPWFQIMSASAASRSDTASNLGAVSAASTTSDFKWSPAGGAQADEIAISSTVTAGSVEVVIPASLVASLGGLPLKWYVNNSCKNWPWEPPSAYFDFAPDSGLYTLGTVTDVCPNIAGDQASVPSGYVKDGSGNCLPPPVDLCPNIAGDQASVPSGYVKDGSGNCVLPVTINGTSAANVLIGNALANLMNGLGANDRLYGRAGNDTLHGNAGNDLLLGEIGRDRLFGDAGIDTARGGSGSDSLKGGAGKDRLYGNAGNDTLDGRDRKPGDVINGGAGRDVCYYNRGDIVTGCEKKVRARAASASAATPAKPGPPLPASLTTASCTTAGQVVTSGVAKYSFKGKVKVTLTTYTAGGFNNFGEPTTATFTTPVEPRFDKVVVTLTCRAPTLDVDGDGVFADDDCPNEAGPASNNGCPLPVQTHFEGNLNLADGQGIVVSCPSGLWPDWANMVLNVNRAVRHSPVDSEGTRIIAANGNSPYGIWFLNEHEDYDRNPLAVTGTYSFDCIVPLPDADVDGTPDATDNCPEVYNYGQQDLDGDGIGNECDSDRDGDGVQNQQDNCPNANPDQANMDGDAYGDLCDEDKDGDARDNWQDKCPNVSGLPELGGCPLPPGSVLVTSGQVTVPAGEEHTILCPAGTVRVNDSDAYFYNFTNGSIVIDGSDWPDEPTGLKVINQNVSASITGVLSMACVPVPNEVPVTSGVITLAAPGLLNLWCPYGYVVKPGSITDDLVGVTPELGHGEYPVSIYAYNQTGEPVTGTFGMTCALPFPA